MVDAQLTSGVGRYARALFEVACGHEQVDSGLQDLKKVQAILNQDKNLQRLILGHALTHEQRQKILQTLSGSLHLSELVVNFLQKLMINQRLHQLAEIIHLYHLLQRKYKGEGLVEIVSTQALTETQTKRLKGALQQYLGQRIKVVYTLDRKLLGGMTFRFNSQVIDASLKARLEQLSLALIGEL